MLSRDATQRSDRNRSKRELEDGGEAGLSTKKPKAAKSSEKPAPKPAGRKAGRKGASSSKKK